MCRLKRCVQKDPLLDFSPKGNATQASSLIQYIETLFTHKTEVQFDCATALLLNNVPGRARILAIDVFQSFIKQRLCFMSCFIFASGLIAPLLLRSKRFARPPASSAVAVWRFTIFVTFSNKTWFALFHSSTQGFKGSHHQIQLDMLSCKQTKEDMVSKTNQRLIGWDMNQIFRLISSLFFFFSLCLILTSSSCVCCKIERFWEFREKRAWRNSGKSSPPSMNDDD